MANLKISALPVATALQGEEKLVVVQGGVTKQTIIENILNTLIPTNITISEATTVNLSDSAYATSELIVLTWSGSNGTMVLNLPSAASNTNRVIRLLSDTTFANATHADLTPIGGDTLDGSTNSYRINKEYEGIQVWSNGTEWFIIQKKG
jgi:hypothetical protein